MWKRKTFETQFCKDFHPKMWLKTTIDERIHNFGVLLYAEKLNVVFLNQYSTSNTFVLKRLEQMCLKWHPLKSYYTIYVKFCHQSFWAPNTSEGFNHEHKILESGSKCKH